MQRHQNPGRSCWCCLRFRRKNASTETLHADYLLDSQGPYEYVVEKLSIKRVPLSLFATQEDWDKANSRTISNASPGTSGIQSSKEAKRSTFVPVLPDRKSLVTFSSYHAKLPKTDLVKASHAAVPRSDDSIISLKDDLIQHQEKQVTSTFLPKKAPGNVAKVIAKEEEMVSHILHTLSSLATLNTKDAIPKDPLHLPKSAVVVPSSVHQRIGGRISVPQSKVHGSRIHHKPLATTPASTALYKGMGPDLERTINALGVAQKHQPGLPTGNLSTKDCNSSHELCSQRLDAGIFSVYELTQKPALNRGRRPSIFLPIKETDPSREMQCLTLDNSSNSVRFNLLESETGKQIRQQLQPFTELTDVTCHPIIETTRLPKEFTTPTRRKQLKSDEDWLGDVSPDLTEHLNTSSESLSSSPRKSGDKAIEGSISTTSIISDTLQRLQNWKNGDTLTDDTATDETGSQSRGSEQVTEITPNKGQKLKWKIIIKHRNEDMRKVKTERKINW